MLPKLMFNCIEHSLISFNNESFSNKSVIKKNVSKINLNCDKPKSSWSGCQRVTINLKAALSKQISTCCLRSRENENLNKIQKSESSSLIAPDISIYGDLSSQIPSVKVPFKKRCIEDIHKIQEVIQQNTNKIFKNTLNKENLDFRFERSIKSEQDCNNRPSFPILSYEAIRDAHKQTKLASSNSHSSLSFLSSQRAFNNTINQGNMNFNNSKNIRLSERTAQVSSSFSSTPKISKFMSKIPRILRS